ncbi:helix-turn-helix domain-containing protein [Actinoplanes sp. NPDC049316]|uniref:TetR/AcrR family transcriptional regulator n=1 Tax=Actinoplanes sp. NPDC049316 TaxID=3154727 RepID=UPI00344AC56A
MRADARRNADRIVATAAEVVARDGADASLEDIARRAGVGSATLHRHFPSRAALLEAVFHERVEGVCWRARELTGAPDPYAALVAWLREFGAYVTSTRGLAASLLPGPHHSDACVAMLAEAGDGLLTRAVQAGTVRRDISVTDLLTLVNGVAVATGHGGPGETDRLLTLALEGIAP